jgi:hypothetical protein
MKGYLRRGREGEERGRERRERKGEETKNARGGFQDREI